MLSFFPWREHRENAQKTPKESHDGQNVCFPDAMRMLSHFLQYTGRPRSSSKGTGFGGPPFFLGTGGLAVLTRKIFFPLAGEGSSRGGTRMATSGRSFNRSHLFLIRAIRSSWESRFSSSIQHHAPVPFIQFLSRSRDLSRLLFFIPRNLLLQYHF